MDILKAKEAYKKLLGRGRISFAGCIEDIADALEVDFKVIDEFNAKDKVGLLISLKEKNQVYKRVESHNKLGLS
jgi:hypothetical protein